MRRGGFIIFPDLCSHSGLHAVCVFLVTDRRRGAQEVGRSRVSLRDAGAADAGGAHLCEHLVEPLQGAVQVQLDPAGGAGHRLSPCRDTMNAETDVRCTEKAVFEHNACE